MQADSIVTQIATLFLVLGGAILAVGTVFPALRRVVVYLVAPAVLLLTVEHIVWPLLAQTSLFSWSGLAQMWWLIALVLIAAPLIAVVVGLRLLSRILGFLFGSRAAGHFGGEVLIRRLLRARHSRPIPKMEDTDD